MVNGRASKKKEKETCLEKKAEMRGCWRRKKTVKEGRQHIEPITTQTPAMSPSAPVPPLILYAVSMATVGFCSPPQHKHERQRQTHRHTQAYACTWTQTHVVFCADRWFLLQVKRAEAFSGVCVSAADIKEISSLTTKDIFIWFNETLR